MIEATSARDERGERPEPYNSEENIFFSFPQQTSQVLFKVALKPKKWDLKFSIDLLWNLHVFSSERTRQVHPRASSCSYFEGKLGNFSWKLKRTCGCLHINYYYILQRGKYYTNPITPESMGCFSCTHRFLFLIINITHNIKGCSWLSKPQTSASHIQLCPHPVWVKPADSNPSAIPFLTDPLVCLHLLWQRLLHCSFQTRSRSVRTGARVWVCFRASLKTHDAKERRNSGSIGSKWLILEAFLRLEATNWVHTYLHFTRWLQNSRWWSGAGSGCETDRSRFTLASVTLLWFWRPCAWMGN